MKFGYARVSKQDQNLSLQHDALQKYGVEKIFSEKATGSRNDRPELQRLLDQLRNGDTLVIWKLDRLGRTTKSLLELAEDFTSRGIHLVSLTENLDTATPMGKFTFTMFCAVAQMEREVLAERTKEGLASARARGRIGGKPPVPSDKVTLAVKMYLSNDFSIKQITEASGLGKSSIYKYVKLHQK